MNPQNQSSPKPPFEPQYALHGIAQVVVEAPPAPVAADRLYQLAALTAGLFLLGTML
jgi:hypothetical protein